jgi:hypothetical protein
MHGLGLQLAATARAAAFYPALLVIFQDSSFSEVPEVAAFAFQWLAHVKKS